MASDVHRTIATARRFMAVVQFLHYISYIIFGRLGGLVFVMSNVTCQRRIFRIRWYDLVTNATIINRTGQESVRDKITRRRHAMFGHVRRLPEVTPAHMALHLAVKARTGHRPDNRPQWKCPRGRPRHPWMQQLEEWKSTQDLPLMSQIDHEEYYRPKLRTVRILGHPSYLGNG